MPISRTGTTPGKYTVCTSSTRPSSPAVGDSIYETDTGYFKQYQGATDTWTFPWGTAWGFIAEANVTANQTGITTEVDVAGATVTFTAIANRRYKITGHAILTQVTNPATTTSLSIATGGNTDLVIAEYSIAAAGLAAAAIVAPSQSPAAGSITYKLRASSSAASLTIVAAATAPTSILVEDMGPNGAPS